MKRLGVLTWLVVAWLAPMTGAVASAAETRAWPEAAPVPVVPLEQAAARLAPEFPAATSAAPAPLVARAFAPPRATATVTSVASGSWNAPATWGGSVPGPSDDVVIADGTTVTIDVAASCTSLTVGQGVSGILQFEQVTARALTVAGNVLVQPGGTFRSNAAGTQTGHQLNVAGNVTNNGTLDFSTNGNAAGAGIRFTTAGSVTFGGTGATTDVFGPLTINKGTDATNVVELAPSAFTYKGNATTAGTTAAFLRILNGTFRIAGTFTMSNSLFTLTGSDTIPATGGLTLANPNYTVAARNGSMLLSGRLQVDNGTLNVGIGSGNSLSFSTGSAIAVHGGSLTCAGRLAGTVATSTMTYEQSNGTVTVCTVGNSSGTLASFDLPTTGSSFTMSGGAIVVQGLASAFIDYRNAATVPTLASVSGGTLQLGNAASGAAKEYWVVGQVPGLLLTNTSANHAMRIVGPTNVWQSATISAGTTLFLNNTTPAGQVWSQLGPGITNHGTILGNVAGSRLYYLGNGVAQSYGGTGTLGSAAQPLATLDIDNPLGVTISAASPTVITTRVDLIRGTLANSDHLQLGTGPASTATTQIGIGGATAPGGSYDVAPVFDLGTYNLLYAPETVARTSGAEIPASRQVSLLSITNPFGVTLAGGDVTATSSLALTPGVLHTGANTAIVLAPATLTRTTGYVDGNLQKDVPAGAPSRTFEIGDVTSYTPVTTAFTGVTTPGTVTARTDPGDLTLPVGSGLDDTRSVNRNWTLTGAGGLAFGSATGTFEFLAADVDGGANSAAFEVRKLDGTTWAPTTAGTRTATSTQATWSSSLSRFAIGELAYTITSSAGAGGTIAPLGVTYVSGGANQSYTITSDSCFAIADVLVDGVSVGAVSSFTFTNVVANHTIAASFVPITYPITATAGAGGTIAPPGATVVGCGANQSYTITPDSCFAIADVLVDGVSVGPVSSYAFTNVQASRTIAATFSALTYTITAAAGSGGTIGPLGPTIVACGGTQGYTITPGDCAAIADVLVDGVSVGAVSSYTFTDVHANHTIAVSFVGVTYTITSTAGAGGSIAPLGATPVTCSGAQSYTITADSCFAIADVLVDGVSVGAVASYAFTDVHANHTIAASFTGVTYAITSTAGTGGAIAPLGATTVACGGTQAYTIAADSCFAIADVLVDGVSVGAVTSFTFTNVQASHTIAASFSQLQYTLTASAGAGGSIAPPGVTMVACGGSQGYTITADPGFAILDVLVDAVSVGAVGSHTFANVHANHTIAAHFVETTAPSVTVVLPNGGETLTIGFEIDLKWQASDSVGVTCVDLWLSRGGAGGPWEPIATCAANEGTFPWEVTGPATTHAIFRVDAHDSTGNVGSDLSDQEFEIADPTVAASGAPIREFAIERAAPNPTAGAARIGFAIPRPAVVRLSVFDAQGREVAVLADGAFEPGRYSATWSGNGSGGRLASGIYFLRFHTPDRVLTRRIALQH